MLNVMLSLWNLLLIIFFFWIIATWVLIDFVLKYLMQERGMHLNEIIDIDEETRFSSVYRGKMVDDGSYEENEDILLDSHNDETFGRSSASAIESSIDWTSGKSYDAARMSSSSCATVVRQVLISLNCHCS